MAGVVSALPMPVTSSPEAAAEQEVRTPRAKARPLIHDSECLSTKCGSPVGAPRRSERVDTIRRLFGYEADMSGSRNYHRSLIIPRGLFQDTAPESDDDDDSVAEPPRCRAAGGCADAAAAADGASGLCTPRAKVRADVDSDFSGLRCGSPFGAPSRRGCRYMDSVCRLFDPPAAAQECMVVPRGLFQDDEPEPARSAWGLELSDDCTAYVAEGAEALCTPTAPTGSFDTTGDFSSMPRGSPFGAPSRRMLHGMDSVSRLLRDIESESPESTASFLKPRDLFKDVSSDSDGEVDAAGGSASSRPALVIEESPLSPRCLRDSSCPGSYASSSLLAAIQSPMPCASTLSTPARPSKTMSTPLRPSRIGEASHMVTPCAATVDCDVSKETPSPVVVPVSRLQRLRLTCASAMPQLPEKKQKPRACDGGRELRPIPSGDFAAA